MVKPPPPFDNGLKFSQDQSHMSRRAMTKNTHVESGRPGSNAALTLGKLSNLYEPLSSPSVKWQEFLCYQMIKSMRQHNMSLIVGSQ